MRYFLSQCWLCAWCSKFKRSAVIVLKLKYHKENYKVWNWLGYINKFVLGVGSTWTHRQVDTWRWVHIFILYSCSVCCDANLIFFDEGWEFGGKDGKVGKSWRIYFLQRIVFPSIRGFQEENQSHTLPGTKVLHPGTKMILFLFTSLLCYYAFCCLFDISEKNIVIIHLHVFFHPRSFPESIIGYNSKKGKVKENHFIFLVKIDIFFLLYFH